jgi:hypothetical protein
VLMVTALAEGHADIAVKAVPAARSCWPHGASVWVASVSMPPALPRNWRRLT